MKTPADSLAAKIQQIEKLVAGLESQDQSLEESLVSFEEGIKLIRAAQEDLAKAEQRVQMLTETGTTDDSAS
ncbi:exodeoxyribonuclease VII small subunit [Haliea sp. E17]|uniref:exodeoxyribonuclease VII small subunit n=1 Tax=Haliea sp. E17 TaxID=3401576 RepID=UPI003AAB6DE5